MTALLRRCAYLIGPTTRGRWVGLVGLAMLVSIFEAVGALLIYSVLLHLTGEDQALSLPVVGELTARFPGTDPDRLLVWMTAFMCVFFVVRSGLYLLQSYAQNRVAYNAGVRLSRRLLEGYFCLPYDELLRRNSAELIRNAHESVQLFAMQVLVPAVSMTSEALLMGAVLAVLVVSEPVITILAIVVLSPIVALLLRGIQPRLVRFGTDAQERSKDSLQDLQQSLHGARDIKVLGRERYFEDRFAEHRGALARAFYLRAVLVDVPRVVLETVVVLFLLLFILYATAADRAMSGLLAVLGLFAYAVLRALPSLNRILNSLNSLRFSRTLVEQLHADAAAADAARIARPVRHEAEPMRFERDIVLRHVSYRYPETTVDAISEIDLQIRRGESIGLVGPTGGGKSTLVDLLLGLLVPRVGSLEVDGVDVAADPAAWQRCIGVVPQSVFLLDDTLRANIALGVPREAVDDDAVAEAVGMAQLAGLIAELPEGLETVVGERGVRLSGGQRQRVAIARALYRRPEVLLFDEGTSALDSSTETDLIESLDSLRGDRTLVTVAHRLTTVRSCDRVLIVVGGRIVDSGTYDELLVRSELFRGLAGEQARA